MAQPNVTELIVDDRSKGSRHVTGTMKVDGKRYDFEVNDAGGIRLWLHVRPFVKRRLPLGHRIDLQAIALGAVKKVEG
jgi:hypothetical protein